MTNTTKTPNPMTLLRRLALTVAVLTVLASACASNDGDQLAVPTTTEPPPPPATSTTTTLQTDPVTPDGIDVGEIVVEDDTPTTTTHAADGHTHDDAPEIDFREMETNDCGEGMVWLKEHVTATDNGCRQAGCESRNNKGHCLLTEAESDPVVLTNPTEAEELALTGGIPPVSPERAPAPEGCTEIEGTINMCEYADRVRECYDNVNDEWKECEVQPTSDGCATHENAVQTETGTGNPNNDRYVELDPGSYTVEVCVVNNSGTQFELYLLPDIDHNNSEWQPDICAREPRVLFPNGDVLVEGDVTFSECHGLYVLQNDASNGGWFSTIVVPPDNEVPLRLSVRAHGGGTWAVSFRSG